MRIPITMCHGITWQPKPRKIRHTVNRLTAERFETYFQIASDLGFQSISYQRLADWMNGSADLPERPIMFDFDHPDWSIGRVIWPIMQRFGYTGNLFIHTSPMEKGDSRYCMDWDEVRDLLQAGWHIGAHMHRHYNLDYLARKDPSGGLIREQLVTCDDLIYTHLGIVPRDFAYTGTTWSRIAEREVRQRYRSGRLWIVGTHYNTDQGKVRYADLVGIPGDDEADGGPPYAARYITADADPYRLPSMDLEYLIFELDAYRAYLQGAVGPETRR
jgi:peptidoglycan/xylan/chitin deacetylase (PgdA/CDA1 family)